jgi:hypothetical protein
MKLYLVYVQVATAQIATTGMVSLSYVQKVSEKVSVFHVIFNAYIFFRFYSSFIT